MNQTISELEQIRSNQVDVAIGYGRFASVSRITGTNFIIKVPHGIRSHHTHTEQRIYERLGEYHLILKYYQPAVYFSGDQSIDGLLLQYLELGTLAQNLNTSRWTECRLEWLLQVSEATAFIHSKGIIHGDLGCHNILVQDNGKIALCDFGGSSIDGSQFQEFLEYTRPHYSNVPDVQDDIFALGIVLYEISTGQRLHEKYPDDMATLLFRGQKYPDLLGLLPLGLAGIVKNCWLEGYADMEQLINELCSVLD